LHIALGRQWFKRTGLNPGVRPLEEALGQYDKSGSEKIHEPRLYGGSVRAREWLALESVKEVVTHGSGPTLDSQAGAEGAGPGQ